METAPVFSAEERGGLIVREVMVSRFDERHDVTARVYPSRARIEASASSKAGIS
jgi:hypothetical protein